jgi:hypothetical protein
MPVTHISQVEPGNNPPTPADEGAFILACGQMGWRSQAALECYRSLLRSFGPGNQEGLWLSSPVLGDGVLVTEDPEQVTCLQCLARLAHLGGEQP